MKVLLLGKNGMLGSYFLKALAGEEGFEVFAHGQDTLDVTDEKALQAVFKTIHPDVVINCTAYTAVDACEENKELASKVNGYAPGEIAKACREYDSVLIHFSTDYVFDGNNKDGYKEDDSTGPLSVYGASKLEGEELIKRHCQKYYIVRTAWLYGPNGKNFVETMLELAKTKDELNVVDDQIGCPTYTKDLANAVITNFLITRLEQTSLKHESWLKNEKKQDFDIPAFGIYHLTNSGICSWNEFARKIFEILGKNIKVNKITTDQFPRPAKRPHYSILLNTEVKPLRNWDDALKCYLDLKF